MHDNSVYPRTLGLQIAFISFKCASFLIQKPNNLTIRPSSNTLLKTEIDEIDTPFKTKHSENHTLSGRTSPLRLRKAVRETPPGGLQTLFIDSAWSNKIFLYYLKFRMLQYTSSDVNGYNCYKHLKNTKI